jgi:RNA polymerase sigma-70 factor (ECF subfamily)
MSSQCSHEGEERAEVSGRDLDSVLDSARAGDESGMAELWHALNPPVLRYLRVVVGQAAEDVASETWLQAARDIRRFRGDAAGFRVWLFRVARNRALEELRRSGRRKEDPAGLYTAPDLASRDDPAREAVERMATRQALRLIAELPANQAEAVMLRVVVGLDVTQTAEVLGKRPGAIRIAAMRGLRRLAAVVDGEGLLEAEHAAAGTGAGAVLPEVAE